MFIACLNKPQKLITAVLVSSVFYTINAHAVNILSCDNENTAITATTTHFTDNVDGTISDPETGLIWKKCSEGQSWSTAGNNCIGAATIHRWQAALQRAQDVNAGTLGQNLGQTDWRLPNIKELASIAELRCGNGPAINNTIFPSTPLMFFWSSSPYATNVAAAWIVSFTAGSVGVSFKAVDWNVRLVRSGQ